MKKSGCEAESMFCLNVFNNTYCFTSYKKRRKKQAPKKPGKNPLLEYSLPSFQDYKERIERERQQKNPLLLKSLKNFISQQTNMLPEGI